MGVRASSGCGVGSPAFGLLRVATVSKGSLQTVAVAHGGLDRTYLVFRPRSIAEERPPLIVEFHGMTACAENSFLYTGWIDQAVAAGAVLVWPQSTELLGINPVSGEADPLLTSWNAGYLPVPAVAAGIDDVGFAVAIIRNLTAATGGEADAGRVYVVGHSNGAAMAQRVAYQHAEIVTAVATHSVRVPDVLYGGGVASLLCPPPVTMALIPRGAGAFLVVAT